MLAEEDLERFSHDVSLASAGSPGRDLECALHRVATPNRGNASRHRQLAVTIVADVDDVNLIAGSVQLTSPPPTGMVVPDLPDEVLSWDSSPGGDCDGLTVNYNDVTGTLIINGSATVGRYQACLRSMAYENSRDAMDVRNREGESTDK